MINIIMRSNNFLIKEPWISEKATHLSTEGKYVFVVHPKAEKNEVKKAIESIYKIHIVKMNILSKTIKGKKLKKAIVTLKDGEKIDIVPQ